MFTTHIASVSLLNTEIGGNTKLCPFDIENMYTNIPTPELVNVIKNIMNCDYSTNMDEKDELVNLVNKILEQNYFHFNNQFFKQNEDLAMGAPHFCYISRNIHTTP
jgi:hypothetical protein